MTDQQVLDGLVNGRALVVIPELWVQRVSRTYLGNGIFRHCAGSACSDALGIPGESFISASSATAGTAGPADLLVLGQCINELRQAIPAPWRAAHPTGGVVGYNDDSTTTHADIIAVFDTAIGRVRARIETEAASFAAVMAELAAAEVRREAPVRTGALS